jgi:hypothetical protein
MICIFTGCREDHTENIPINQSLSTQQEVETEKLIGRKMKSYPNRDLPYYLEFKGVEASEVLHEYSNNPYANISDSYQMGPNGFCYVADMDTLYYVNYDRDNYLYAYKDGINQKVIEMSVNYSNYWKGELYFISDTSSTSLYGLDGRGARGKLYKHNISSDETQLILEQDVWDIRICDGMIYYQGAIKFEGNTLPVPTFYRMPIESGDSEETTLRPYFYGEYQLQIVHHDQDPSRIALPLNNGQDQILLTNYRLNNLDGVDYCIAEGRLWFLHNTGKDRILISIHLEIGEETRYACDAQRAENITAERSLNGISVFIWNICNTNGRSPDFLYTTTFSSGEEVRSFLMQRDDLYAIPLMGVGEQMDMSCIFLCVNPESNTLQTTLEYISTLAEYFLHQQNTGMSNDLTKYTDSVYAKSLYQANQNAKISFQIPYEILQQDMNQYFEGQMDVEELINEAGRKLDAYLNE